MTTLSMAFPLRLDLAVYRVAMDAAGPLPRVEEPSMGGRYADSEGDAR